MGSMLFKIGGGPCPITAGRQAANPEETDEVARKVLKMMDTDKYG